ncbi:hypothetical protein [Lacticaseibacillus jixiensis]
MTYITPRCFAALDETKAKRVRDVDKATLRHAARQSAKQIQYHLYRH